jgi:heavy metal sensor kinase
MRRRFSIRIVLAAWSTVMLTLMVCGLAVAMYFGMRHTVVQVADENLSGRLREIGPFIEDRLHNRHGDDLSHEFLVHLSGLRPGGDLLQVRSQGRWIYRSPSIAPYQLTPPAAADLAEPRFATISVRGALLRTLSAQVRVAGTAYTVELAEPIGEYYAMLERFSGLALWFLPVLLALAAAGGYWWSRRALAPVEAISATAREISARNLSLRLTVPQTGDEIQNLSETLNGMIARLDEAFGKISEFTANAAHELRSPIAVMLTTSELALRTAGSESELRQSLDEIRAEAIRTAGLVEDLLALARADVGPTGVARVLDLSEIVGEICRRGETLARARQIDFQTSITAGVRVAGDPQAIARMLMILVDNAIKYTPAGGMVTVTLDREGLAAVCTVADNGIGIAVEDQPHVFERFYRADRARSRDAGGSGLGLAIARGIAEAHGARIDLDSAVGQGTTVRVVIPSCARTAPERRAGGVDAGLAGSASD